MNNDEMALVKYISDTFNQLRKENEGVLEYSRNNILNLIDDISEIHAQLYLLTNALTKKGIFEEGEINKILSKKNINIILEEIDKRIKKEFNDVSE